MSKEQILGFVRHLLTFGSGFAVGQGWLDESLAGEIVAVGVGIAGVVWSYLAKR